MGWYVLYCRAGQEEQMIRSCRQHLSEEALEEVFQLSYERMKKYLGEWHVDTYAMFPGYVFLQSEYPDKLAKELKRFQAFSVLERGGSLLRVQKKEEAVIRRLCEDGHHMRLSRSIIKDGRIKVTDGPLRGRESLVKKFDLHRRIAILNLNLGLTEERRDIWAGIDVVKESR